VGLGAVQEKAPAMLPAEAAALLEVVMRSEAASRSGAAFEAAEEAGPSTAVLADP
jgi:hypothetical protein